MNQSSFVLQDKGEPLQHFCYRQQGVLLCAVPGCPLGYAKTNDACVIHHVPHPSPAICGGTKLPYLLQIVHCQQAALLGTTISLLTLLPILQ